MQSMRLSLLLTLVPAAALAAGPFGLAYQLTHSVNADPTFSPDGKRLIYVSEIEGKDQLFVMDADGKNQKQITREPYDHEDPAWSPDGRKILFTRLSGSVYSDGDVYVMNADGRGQRNLTPSLTHPFATDTTPAWSPDGRRILFVSNRDGKGEVYVMNADGSGLRKLTQLKGES